MVMRKIKMGTVRKACGLSTHPLTLALRDALRGEKMETRKHYLGLMEKMPRPRPMAESLPKVSCT
jgi:hypothetical protein